jgi:hypothetical protein
MSEENLSPQINASKLRIGGGIAGVLFTIGSMLIFLIGIPILRYLFPAAILLGCVAALVFRFKPHQTPGAPWLLSAIEKTADVPSKRDSIGPHQLNHCPRPALIWYKKAWHSQPAISFPASWKASNSAPSWRMSS